MVQINVVAIILGIILFPFAFAAFLYGCIICKELLQQVYTPRKKGLEQTVKVWENLTPDERMEATRAVEEQVQTRWVNSPTPKDEEKAMNERVFHEGLLHPLSKTDLQNAKDNE